MSHEILNDRVAVAVSSTTPLPWWKVLGDARRGFEWHPEKGDNPTVVEVATMAGFGYQVNEMPLFTFDEKTQQYTPLLRNGDPVKGIVREPLHDDPHFELMGVASENYKIMDNMKLAEMLEPLNAAGMKINAAGVLKHGRQVFFTFEAEPFSVYVHGKEDPHETYLTFLDGKEVGTSFGFHLTGFRVICANTVRAAEAMGEKYKIRLSHGLSALQDVDEVAKTLATVARSRAAMQTFVQAMCDYDCSDELAEKLFQYSIPQPLKPQRLMLAEIPGHSISAETVKQAKINYEYAQVRREEFLNRVRVAWHTEGQGKLYGAVNAGTGVYEHQSVSMGKVQRNASPERLANAAQFGERLPWCQRIYKGANMILAGQIQDIELTPVLS